jgi:hypothetical protein
MLPWMKKKDQQVTPSLTIKTREPDKTEENQEHAGIHACAQDLLSAIQANDVKGIADALKAAFEIADASPHVEGEHIEPHSYDASKEE